MDFTDYIKFFRIAADRHNVVWISPLFLVVETIKWSNDTIVLFG